MTFKLIFHVRLQLIKRGIWSLYVIRRANGEDPLQRDLPRPILFALLAKLDHIANSPAGPQSLGENVTHLICNETRIWQLSARHPYRLPYFFDEGRMIILTHVAQKQGGKTQSTPTQEIERARALKAEYEAAKRAKKLTFED